MRDMVKEVYIDKDDLIYPLFIEEGEDIKSEISSMPGQYRISLDKLEDELEELLDLGLKKVILFGIPKEKDDLGTQAYFEDGIIQRAIKKIKSITDEIMIITDVCMCEYTSHGHCGIIKGEKVDNDITLDYLKKIALSHCKAGADMVAPSDMMDGRVGVIRKALDKGGYEEIPIMSYSVKYNSSFYGPFRDAADSAPDFGDRKRYQMDFRRKNEAVYKAKQDIKEGADIVMVKPGMAYLDVVSKIKSEVNVPVAIYSVSGEYSMVKAAAKEGWVDEKGIVLEKMYAMKRAGADIIITYYAKDIAKWIK